MQITRIKLALIKTEVSYNDEIGNTLVETKIRCEKPRDPEFTRVSQSFISFIIKTLKLPDEWKGYDNSFLTSVKFDYTEQGLGVVFEIAHRLAGFPEFLIIKTPRYCEGKNIKFESALPSLIANELYRLIEHAKNFIAGQRDQRDLFSGDDSFIEQEIIVTAGSESVTLPKKTLEE